MKTEPIKSLFVVSLPRSLSCMVYHASRRCLGLREPSWTTDGEFLNADRFALLPQPNNDFSNKFTMEVSERERFKKITEFLDQIVVLHGFAYKDVVQPFVVGEWIKKNQPPTIRLRRNVADIAYSMLQNHWHYPKRLFPSTGSLELGIVQGLLRAQDALDSIPAESLDFDRLIYDEELLCSALTSLYGDHFTKKPKYIDDEFRRRREEIMRRRSTRQYGVILDYIARAKQSPV